MFGTGAQRVFRKRFLGAAAAAVTLFAAPAATAATWDQGDVFAGVGNGSYNVYDNSGTFKETVSDGQGGFTTGCAFRPGTGDLYTTNFSASNMPVYTSTHPHAVVRTVNTATDGGSLNESVVFDGSGNFYVGNAGTNQILKYNSADAFVTSYTAATEARGTDWIDLSKDQKTIFYTSEGSTVFRFDTAANAQLADFATGLSGGPHYALRLLPPGDGSGGLLVAGTAEVQRLDATGAIVQTYDVTGEDQWFALNLDPNGTSFWSGSFDTNNFYRFNIATGAVEVGPISSGGSLFGLCLKGEVTAAVENCTNGVDDDGDGLIDGADPDCPTAGGECSDGIDNDGDGKIDFGSNQFHNDPDCDSPSDRERPECSDHVDNDGDGKTDFSRNRFHKDPQCSSARDDNESH